MQLAELTQPFREICDCCRKELIAFRSEDEKIRYQCPDCGTITVKHFRSRYHYIKDVRRPRSKEETTAYHG